MSPAHDAARVPLKSSGAHPFVGIDSHERAPNVMSGDMPVMQSFKLAKL
jgi:hypothetical protein